MSSTCVMTAEGQDSLRAVGDDYGLPGTNLPLADDREPTIDNPGCFDDDVEVAEMPFRTFEICDASGADLIVQLKTGGHVLHYHVCRPVLAIASPVFMRMVDSNSRLPSTKKRKRDRGDDDVWWYLDLYDDDPEALLVLLRAIHLQTLPSSIEFEQLLSIALLCDKYDCVRPLAPWKNKWLDQWCSTALEDGHEGWLDICVIFGETRKFYELTKDMVLNFGNDYGACERGHESEEGDNDTIRMPHKLFYDIEQKRQDALISLHSVVSKFLRTIESYDLLGTSPQSLYQCSQTCMSACYGTFVLQSQKDGLWEFLKLAEGDPKARKMMYSPYGFRESISRLFSYCRSAISKENIPKHGKPGNVCVLSMHIHQVTKELESAYEGIGGLNPEDYIRHRDEAPVTWEKIVLPSLDHWEPEEVI